MIFLVLNTAFPHIHKLCIMPFYVKFNFLQESVFPYALALQPSRLLFDSQPKPDRSIRHNTDARTSYGTHTSSAISLFEYLLYQTFQTEKRAGGSELCGGEKRAHSIELSADPIPSVCRTGVRRPCRGSLRPIVQDRAIVWRKLRELNQGINQ